VRWCGNESGYTGLTSWSKVRPEGFAPGRVADHGRLVTGDPDGSVWRPVEVDVSTRPGWFWHPTERAKSGAELFAIWLASVGRGASLNLNITPDRRGLIPEQDVLSLVDFEARRRRFTAVDLAEAAGVSGRGTGEIVADFGRRVDIGGVRVEEAIAGGQRVSEFAVEIRHSGAWYEWARGTTIGARRIIPTPGASGSAARVRVLASQATPALAELHVYAG